MLPIFGVTNIARTASIASGRCQVTVRTPTGFVSRRTGGWRRADRSSDKSHSRSVSAVVNRELSIRFHRKFSVQHFDETRAVEPLETHRDPERRSRRDNPDRSGDHVNNISNRPTRVALEETEEGAHKDFASNPKTARRHCCDSVPRLCRRRWTA